LNTTNLNKKILIVDDNGINRKYAISVLSKAGINVRSASGGYEALDMLKAEDFDLILLDIQMPDLDGFETLAKIKSDLPSVDCPILAVTAFYGDDGKISFKEAGFNDFVRKPIKPDQLILIVNSWIKKAPVKINSEVLKSEGLIDMHVYNEIKKYAQGSDINDLYEDFVNETEEYFHKLKFLISSKNYPEILSTLHTIKGSSGSLGIIDLAVNSEKLEIDIKSEKKLDLNARIEQLNRDFLKFKKEYKQLLNLKT